MSNEFRVFRESWKAVAVQNPPHDVGSFAALEVGRLDGGVVLFDPDDQQLAVVREMAEEFDSFTIQVRRPISRWRALWLRMTRRGQKLG